jgi:glutamate-1-semialdehyde 2,1-aminomutase
MSAVRLARAFTKKETLIKFNGNYHGHADPFLVKAGSGVANLSDASSLGVTKGAVQQTLSLPYNDCETLTSVLRSEKVACVIVEPVAANMGLVLPTQEFLQTLRRETAKRGALLIFDEVITGFRLGLQGAQGVFGIEPDLTTLGKIVGGGFPAAAFGGRGDVMDLLAPVGPVYQAGTLSGNPVAMEAGLKAIELAESPGFYEELDRKASWITHGITQGLTGPLCHRMGSLLTLFFGIEQAANFEEVLQSDQEMFAKLYRFLREHGVLIPPSPFEAWFISSQHTERDLKETNALLRRFLGEYI